MSQESSKKLILIKNLYYRIRNQDGILLANETIYKTNPPTASSSGIIRLTDKNYTPVDNGFMNWNFVVIPANNPLSGITKQIFQETLMIKTKCGFVSANTFYFDSSSSNTASIDKVDYYVTAGNGEFKNAYIVRLEFDNDGNKFSKGVKFARRISIFACE